MTTAPFRLDPNPWVTEVNAVTGPFDAARPLGTAGADILFEAAHVAEDELPCRIQDPDLWFAESPGALERAKAFCAECPVRAACLSGALARREPWGVWGGEIFDHGAVIPRKRPRGRPRKDAGVAA